MGNKWNNFLARKCNIKKISEKRFSLLKNFEKIFFTSTSKIF